MEKLSDKALNGFIEACEAFEVGSEFTEGLVLSGMLCGLELKQLRAEKAAYLLLAEANLKKDGK
jgi:hypothetical protein